MRSFEEYQARLKEHFVVLTHAERRERIARDLEGHARRLGGRVSLKDHHALLDEVADLVEFPAVVAGSFDPAFLALPEEVLSTTLVHHQHYFPVLSDRGDLKEAFLAVVNTQPKDERPIAKNAERVVTARLRDARFFWESDRKVDAGVAARAAAHCPVPQEAGELSRQGGADRGAGGVDCRRGVRAGRRRRRTPAPRRGSRRRT